MQVEVESQAEGWGRGVYIPLAIVIETELGFLRKASSRSVRIGGERNARHSSSRKEDTV